jgi:hypothetical protein
MSFDYSKLVVGQKIALGYKSEGCSYKSLPTKVKISRMCVDGIRVTVCDNDRKNTHLYFAKVVYISSDYILIDQDIYANEGLNYKSILLNHEVQL